VIANERQIKVGDQQLIGSGALIKALLADGTDTPGLQLLGATAWWFLSGVSHAFNYALLESVEPNNPPLSPLAPNTVPIFTSSRSVAFQGLILGLGYRTLIEEHRHVFGWGCAAWKEAVDRFIGETRLIVATVGPP